MATNSPIQWTDHTFNPWIGCTKVSPGCDACYAEALDRRWYGGTHWGPGAPRRRTSDANWREPLRWNRKAEANGARPRVFCASLADVFDNEVPDEWRTDLFDLIRAAANLDWLLVTKRIGNAKAMLPPDWGDGWPHVMLIATVVDQDEADRDVPKLIGTPAERRGVSYEPALGLVDFRPWLRPGGLDWIIVGGESDQGGRKARPFHLAWAASIVMQGASAGVPVFVKQLGSHPMIGDERVVLRDRAGGDMGEWEPFFGVRQFPRPEARP